MWRTTPAEYAAHVRSLVDATLRDSGAVPGERPRVLIVSAAERAAAPARTDPALDALREEVDYCVIAPGERGAPIRRAAVGPGSIQLVRRWPGFLDPLFFYGGLPFRVPRLVRRFRPGAVIAESPYIGFFVLVAMSLRRRDRPSIVVEMHGDWRTATRHGGSRLRVLVAPLADWAARYALRHADALRAVSPFTAELAGREAGLPTVESFPAYIDLGAFTGRPPAPLPEQPTLLFVGMLERSKGVTALADAWPRSPIVFRRRVSCSSDAAPSRTSSTAFAMTIPGASSTSSSARPRASPSAWTGQRASSSRRAPRVSAG